MTQQATHNTGYSDGAAYVCLDFRREKLADPKRISSAAQEHLASCSMCQAFARRIDKTEAAVAETLSVPLPEGLNDRILLRVHKGRKSAWRALALAASVVLTVAVSLHIGNESGGDSAQLAMAAAAHAGDETAEIHSHKSLDASQFGLVLSNFGGAMQQPLGQVRYIHFCPIEGFGMGWHIAYDTPQGKVTLLLIPGKHGGPDTQTVQLEGMQVRVQRAGQGYYAIITNSMPSLEAADRDLKTKVRWSS
ncbi:DUF3379 family protein [Uliginosibacterium sp. H3]|uniref:DUF3379 family protein n=1 Tax=Uliginosibacterium silvisoli TaxID=3114758 RepID=A0ABU6K7C8_9RHOO|nr:DUF3379 family protein [Uliginosibacterium sp. H3]